MITLNQSPCYQILSHLANNITQAYTTKGVHIAYGKAVGFAIAMYPEKYSHGGLTRYLNLVELLARQKELEIVKKEIY